MIQKKHFSNVVISTYDAFLADKDLWPVLKPDCVIQFGQIVVSKRVQQMVASWDNVEYIEGKSHDGLDESNGENHHTHASKHRYVYAFVRCKERI